MARSRQGDLPCRSRLLGLGGFILEKDRLLTIEEAAQYLNISKTTLRRWTKVGTLRCSRIGVKGERRFLQKDLDACVSRDDVSVVPPDTPAGSTDPVEVLAEAALRPAN